MYNDYPLAPENFAILYDMLSDYCKKIADEYGVKVGDVKTLIPNLADKTNYVFYYKNLRLHLSLEMKLTKIHRMVKLRQSDWMILTQKKEKMLLIVLKKTFLSWWSILLMAKQWKIYKKNRLANNGKRFLKDTSRSTHITRKIFDKDYATIHEVKPILMLNKPIYVGFTALELGKWLMYDFHYNFI